MKLSVVESISGSEVEGKPGVFSICIIKAGQGSSGYYPAAVVERDGPTVFAKDTQVYIDHETMEEQWIRPERTVRDLAGYISSTPVWDEAEGGLMAEMTIFPSMAEMVRERMSHVGMSIRAYVEAEYGEVEGGFTEIVTRFVEALSVDIVTKAGAGGAILEAVESAKTGKLSEADAAVLKHIQENTLWRKGSDPKGAPSSNTKPASKSVVESKKGSVMAELSDETAAKLAEALTGHTAAMNKAAEAEEARVAAASAAAAEADKVDPLDVAAALAESGLPKGGQARVLESVKGGAKLEDAIKSEKDYVAELTAGRESEVDSDDFGPIGGRRASESGGTKAVESATAFASSWGKKGI